jgi:hypothetical protein
MRREEPGYFYPIIKEWGKGMGSSQPGEGDLGHPWATYRSSKLFLFLACL